MKINKEEKEALLKKQSVLDSIKKLQNDIENIPEQLEINKLQKSKESIVNRKKY